MFSLCIYGFICLDIRIRRTKRNVRKSIKTNIDEIVVWFIDFFSKLIPFGYQLEICKAGTNNGKIFKE